MSEWGVGVWAFRVPCTAPLYPLIPFVAGVHLCVDPMVVVAREQLESSAKVKKEQAAEQERKAQAAKVRCHLATP